jgi:hypothetical protein
MQILNTNSTQFQHKYRGCYLVNVLHHFIVLLWNMKKENTKLLFNYSNKTIEISLSRRNKLLF